MHCSENDEGCGFYDFTTGCTPSLEPHLTSCDTCIPKFEPISPKTGKIISFVNDNRQISQKVITNNGSNNGGLNISCLPNSANNSLLCLNSKMAKSTDRFKFSVIKKSHGMSSSNAVPCDETQNVKENIKQSKFKISRISRTHGSEKSDEHFAKEESEKSEDKNKISIHIEFTPKQQNDQPTLYQPRMANSYEGRPFDDLIDIF